MGVGNVISSALSGMTGPGGASSPSGQPSSGGAPSGAVPLGDDFGSKLLLFYGSPKEDILAAIQAGDLNAKKIGNAYRISKDALEKYLAG